MASIHQYQDLDDGHHPVEAAQNLRPSSLPKSSHRACLLFFTTFLLASTFSLALANYYSLITHSLLGNLYSPLLPSKSSQRYTTCGSTPGQARDRNCSFDILSFAWQTPECYDEPLMAAFLSHQKHPIIFWTNNTAVETVPIEVAAKGEMNLHVTWETHVIHCTYMWMQMHRAYGERGYIDSHLDNWAHTKHCQVVILEKEIGPQTVNAEGTVNYPECRDVRFGKPANWPLTNAFAPDEHVHIDSHVI